MRYIRKFIPILFSLISMPTFVFADADVKNQNYKDHDAISAECDSYDSEDAVSFFILETLFSNTESPYPTELWENRDNEQMSIFEIAREIKSIAKLKDRVFSNTEEAKQAILFARLAQLEDIADRVLVMEADKWKPGYVNELMKHIIGIRYAGISARIPRVVNPENCKDRDASESSNPLKRTKDINIINPCDEKGRRWTSQARLADSDHEGMSIASYMESQGTDIQLIKNWWDGQLAGSWWAGSAAVKFFYSDQRTLDPQFYYWEQGGYEAAKSEYTSFWKKGAVTDNECTYLFEDKEEEYKTAFTIWHAYVQEVLSKTDFYHNNLNKKEVCIIRTTGINGLKRNNITDFGKEYTMSSAAYDSCSLINIYGSKSPNPKKVIIESRVPHHRIIHLYPLLVPNQSSGPESVKAIREEVSFLKNYYDNNGALKIDKKNPLSAQKFVEEHIYYSKYMREIEANKNIESVIQGTWVDYSLDHGFNLMEQASKGLLATLPEQIEAEKVEEALFKILNNRSGYDVESSSTFFHETEVVVLSGPDLPFDYFYNANDDLSSLERRLNNGEGACGYWPELKDLKEIEYLGGSTGAVLYQNEKTGKKYVLKKGASEGHIREEALADNLYGAMGYAVPESRLYESPEGPVKVAVYLENAKSLYYAYAEADETEKLRLRNEISKGFVVDALLVNFDVVGLEMDNILVGDDGEVYRVDNGASFRYQAMGRLKNDTLDESRKSWNASPIALWTLRDPKKNRNCAEMFADLNIYEIAEKIEDSSITERRLDYAYILENNIIRNIVSFTYQYVFGNNLDLQTQINKRHENFVKVADKALKMKSEGLSAEEADIELRKWVEAEDWGPAFD